MPHVITQISQAVKREDRVNIFLNGAFWIGLGKNDLISLRLSKGQELTDAEKETIEKSALDSRILEKAYMYVQIRPRSCGEVRDYLIYRKQLSAEKAENVIAYLQEKELLSDEKFAQWYAEYKLSTGANGPNKIKMELMQKHISATIIASVLEQIYASEQVQDDETEKIIAYAKKVVGSIKAKDPYELKSKLVQKLMARGYKYSDIKKVMSNNELLEPTQS